MTYQELMTDFALSRADVRPPADAKPASEFPPPPVFNVIAPETKTLWLWGSGIGLALWTIGYMMGATGMQSGRLRRGK
jgi:hypothetical protein